MNYSHPEINPDAPGRQLGALYVDVHDLGGIVSRRVVPYAQISHGEGLTIAIVACNGSESIEAAQVISELIRDLSLSQVSGRLRLISVLDASSDPRVLEARQKAVAQQVLDGADLIIELTGAQTSWDWYSTAMSRPGISKTNSQLAEQARVAFGAPFSLNLSSPTATPASPDICLADDRIAPPIDLLLNTRSSLADACRQRGIEYMQVVADHHPAEQTMREILGKGCRNSLVALGMLEAQFSLRASRTFRCTPSSDSALATAAGSLQMLARPGQQVYRGDVLANIVDPADPWHSPTRIPVSKDAVVVATRRGSMVAPGDAIALLADEIQG